MWRAGVTHPVTEVTGPCGANRETGGAVAGGWGGAGNGWGVGVGPGGANGERGGGVGGGWGGVDNGWGLACGLVGWFVRFAALGRLVGVGMGLEQQQQQQSPGLGSSKHSEFPPAMLSSRLLV